MGRLTKVRETDVVDVDFTTEQEAQQFIDAAIQQHIIDTPHGSPPIDPNTGLSYYWDDVRQKYLSTSTNKEVFYEDSWGVKRKYLYNIPGIRSSSMPLNLTNNYTIIKIEVFSTSNLPTGNIIKLKDDVNNSTIMTINNSNNSNEYLIDNLDIYINNLVELKVRVLNKRINNPVVKIYFKEVIVP